MFCLQIREKIKTTVTTIIDKIFRIVEAIQIKEIHNYNRRPNNGNWRNQQNFNVGHDQNNARSGNTHNNTRSYGNRNNARNFQNSNVRSFNSENREGPLPNSREGEM
jgi:hypothetical protein